MMAKRREKDQGGCIWSLMSKLHSCGGGSTLKLLNRNRCTEEATAGQGISRMGSYLMTVHDENVSKPSVKTPMEEETIEVDVEWINSLKQVKRSCDRVRDDDNESSYDRSDEKSSAEDVRDVVEYLCSLFQQRSGIWEEQDEHGEEEFSRALGKVLSQQLFNGRRLSEDEMLPRSKVFVSLLRILNSAEFSLLELMRDPEAMLMKCMEILQQSSSKSSAAKSIFSREEGCDRIKTNVGSPLVPSRIVILKPWMTEIPKPAKSLNPGISRGTESISVKRQKKKSGVPSFLSDIKRKLQNIVTNEYADESADSIGKNSRKEHGRRGSLEKKKPFCKDFKHEPACVGVRTNNHLSEGITNGDQYTSSSSRDPETMGTILLHPELNSSLQTSPGRRWGYGAVNGTSSRIVRNKWRKPELAWVAETDKFAFKILAENIRPSAANGDGAVTKVVPDSIEESSVGLLIIKKGDEDPENAVDLPERPSPVSVLEQHFSDDDTSPAIFERGMPARDFHPSAEFPRQHLEIELEVDDDICVAKADARERTFEEDKGLVLDRVASLLRASGLKWEDLYLKSQTSNRLLEPSLLHERHLFKDDAKLLVDCVNEVLSESCCRFISRSYLSLAKQRIKPVPSMDFTIHEVCRGVKWLLDPIPHPCSVEQIVGKDFRRTRSWMDLTFEGESISFEVCDAILSELMDEIPSTAARSPICLEFADPT